MEFKHISVLLDESVDALDVKPGGIYADGTLGGGGHSELICSRLGTAGTLIGIDRDETAIRAASERLSSQKCKVITVHDNFFNIKRILENLSVEALDGAVLDLGVSSPQLDDGDRGFSYNIDAPLDMRMDRSAALTAYRVVNEYSESELRRILFEYGEEKNSAKIAKNIVKSRAEKPIETTFELSEIIKRSFPPKARYADKHPAKRSFQAIRIEVNGELDGLGAAIEDLIECLKPGGRIAIISFHSLEDRIVKNTFVKLKTGCTCPKEFPVCVCGNKPKIKLVGKKPITAGKDELLRNSRAHSAKLRAAEKL